MKLSITKIAFFDPSTEEFYCGEKGYGKMLFSKELEKAKLYLGTSYDFSDIATYIKSHSNRELVGIDVVITYEATPFVGNLATTVIDDRRLKLQSEFETLDAIAQIDVDNLSESQWRRWKKLKRDLEAFV